jgi:membrane protein
MIFFRRLKYIFDDTFIEKLTRDAIFDLAAALSYYTALSLAPLLILLITFVSFMGDGFKIELIQEIQSLVGSQAAKAISLIVENADQRENLRGLAGLFGLFTLLFSAGAIFGQLRTSLDKIFEVELAPLDPKKSPSFFTSSMTFFKQKIFNMGMVLTFVFISIVSLIVSSVISLWFKGVEFVMGQLINFAISVFIFTLLFSAIYYFLPQKKMNAQLVIRSGLITAILFSIGKTLIGLYLGQSAVGSAYGAAGSMILLLMWVYYSSVIIFLGAEISRRIEIQQEGVRRAKVS